MHRGVDMCPDNLSAGWLYFQVQLRGLPTAVEASLTVVPSPNPAAANTILFDHTEKRTAQVFSRCRKEHGRSSVAVKLFSTFTQVQSDPENTTAQEDIQDTQQKSCTPSPTSGLTQSFSSKWVECNTDSYTTIWSLSSPSSQSLTHHVSPEIDLLKDLWLLYLYCYAYFRWVLQRLLAK